MVNNQYDISVVLGSKNRKNLLKATINSIRENGFTGKMQIIVVDGGSKDGTCNWLAKQKDIFTIIQPNYKIIDQDGISILAHSWGEFMNIAFKYASAPWIVMVSDDLILAKGALQKGYEELVKRTDYGEKIGGGAFYFREYPRNTYYRIGLLPKDYVAINHGFFYKEALENVNYIEEKEYNFYCADGDLIMKMHEKGWISIPLVNSFADHLVHKPVFNKKTISRANIRDIQMFKNKYPFLKSKEFLSIYSQIPNKTKAFWKMAPLNCCLGILLRLYDKIKKSKPLIAMYI